MATNPSTLTENAGRIIAPNANYTYGSAKDDSTGVTGDGTPIKKALMNDSYGFFQAAMVAAGIVPSGNAETVLQSQILQALQGVVGSFSDKKQWPTVVMAADADHDITFNAGKITDSNGMLPIVLTSALTKRIDAPWAAGTGNGGLFSGTVAASTTYHLFVVVKDSDLSVDAGFDTDSEAANIPTGYTAYRRIASMFTDASANIEPFFHKGDRFTLKDPIPSSVNGNDGIPSSVDTIVDVDVPKGVENMVSNLSLYASQGTGDSLSIITIPLEVDSQNANVSTNTPWFQSASATVLERSVEGFFDMQTGTTSQYKMRGMGTNVGNNILRIITHGWVDDRG